MSSGVVLLLTPLLIYFKITQLGLGSPLPGVVSPSIALIYSSRTASHVILHIQAKPHHMYIFQQNSIVNIYFSRIASPVYAPAEQHRMFVYAPWEWRRLGVVARHPQLLLGTSYMNT